MRNLKIQILSIIILAISTTKVDCQNSVKAVNFRVVSANSGNPVELAHVINKTQRDAAIADMLGYFRISVAFGDTISITSLGFFNQIIYSWGQFDKDSIYYTIKLNPRTYELKELKFSWFSNYDSFLKGVLQLQLPLAKEEKDVIRIVEYFKKSISKLNLKDLPQTLSGAMFGRDWLARQNEKLAEKLEKEKQRRSIERKYSAGIVEALTGLTGNEVFWFMEYCAFTDEYILKTSDYNIRLRVLDKFKIYHKDKPTNDLK